MLDLFGMPVLRGLATADNIINVTEEDALIAAIDAARLSPFRFQGWAGKRMTVSYGWIYDFGTGRIHRGDPIPGWLLPLRDRAAVFAGLPREHLAQALLIRYDVGAGIGWHRDRPNFEHVIGISLGSPQTMRFRRRREKGFERLAVHLSRRGAYHLSGEARHVWEHSIAEHKEPRWSVTFRSLRDRAA